MYSWQILSYSGDLLLQEHSVPKITDPKQVLVRVTASSINILDVYMKDGYGRILLNKLKNMCFLCSSTTPVFPLTMGRDFVGEIIETGSNVKSDYKKGTTVMGSLLPCRDGSHSEYVVVHQYFIAKKPESLTDIQAASLIYAGITAWSALKISGDLSFRSAKGKTVLVIGASGGVGSIAIQMLKAWGAKVIATCHTNAVEMIEHLSPDAVLDYTKENFFNNVKNFGPYDIILDTAGLDDSQVKNYVGYLRSFSFSKLISLLPPYLPNTDKYGVFFGCLKSIYDIIVANTFWVPFYKLCSINYGVFCPLRCAIEEIVRLVENNQLHAVIDSVYHFSETPEAYEKVKNGHLRGKVVVDHSAKPKGTGFSLPVITATK